MLNRIFVDANVLVSRTLRDWVCLLRAEIPAMFQLHTTEDVLAEALHAFRRIRKDAPGGAVTRMRAAIVGSMDEVLDDFDATIPYGGTDPDDRHVHAAAVSCQADILLTEDAGFVESDQTPYEVYRCDDFFCLVDDSAPEHVRNVVLLMSRYWRSRPDSRPLDEQLVAAGCAQFAERVTAHLRFLSGA